MPDDAADQEPENNAGDAAETPPPGDGAPAPEQPVPAERAPARRERPAPAAREEKAPARPMAAMSAAGGHAVVVAEPPRAAVGMPALPQVSRRSVVLWGWWIGMTSLVVGITATIVNMLWSRTAQRLAGEYTLEVNANDIAPGTKRDVVVLVPNESNPLQNLEAKIFLVRLNDEQARLNGAPDKAGGYMALSRICPHLGCTVPYNPTFTFPDPDNGGQVITGWFRCPCHGSTYSDSGRRVFGPAPRSMDVYELIVAEDGTMSVNLSNKAQGSQANAQRAVFPGEAPA